MSLRLRSVAAIALVIAPSIVRADDDDPARIGFGIFETAVAVLPPVWYYWHAQTGHSVDWTLDWSWASWNAKLVTFDAVRFDTNPWHINAIRHPLTGVLHHQIGRANGFGLLGSVALAAGASAFWEYVVEFHENPSINDLIMNPAGAIGIGEPMWQIGRALQEGGYHVAGSLFTPVDTVNDAIGKHQRHWWSPQSYRSFDLAGGPVQHRLADTAHRVDALLVADLEVFRDPHYVAVAPFDGPIKPGAWSRMRISVAANGADVTGTRLSSRTAIAGRYVQDDDGDGAFAGIGSAFTYRREDIGADEWDRVVIAHLLGPQLQLVRRLPGLVLRWDAFGYADFAMLQAHVFADHDPFPRPPPYVNALEAEDYYDAAGVTANTRLRANTPAWSADLEVEAHRLWQLGRDRVDGGPTGASDLRVYARGEVAYHRGAWAIGAIGEALDRHGAWSDEERRTVELSAGALLHVVL